MKVFKISVNLNNLKREINSNYFLYKEIFNKILVIHLYNIFSLCPEYPLNLILEDSNNQQLLNYLLMNKPRNQEAFSILGIDSYTSLYLDLSLYIDSILQDHYRKDDNVYLLSIFIEDNGYVTLILRRIASWTQDETSAT